MNFHNPARAVKHCRCLLPGIGIIDGGKNNHRSGVCGTGLGTQNSARQTRKGAFQGTLCLSRRAIEPGETPEVAVRREVFEETGLAAGHLEPLETLNPGRAVDRPGSSAYRLHVFWGSLSGGDPVAGDDADKAGWFTLDETEALPMTKSSLRLARKLLRKSDEAE